MSSRASRQPWDGVCVCVCTIHMYVHVHSTQYTMCAPFQEGRGEGRHLYRLEPVSVEVLTLPLSLCHTIQPDHE